MYEIDKLTSNLSNDTAALTLPVLTDSLSMPSAFTGATDSQIYHGTPAR